jgi:hypothetical protein
VAKLNAFLQEKITGMRIVQLFASEEFQRRTFAEINHENYVAGMKQIRIFAVFMPVMDLFLSFAVALLIGTEAEGSAALLSSWAHRLHPDAGRPSGHHWTQHVRSCDCGPCRVPLKGDPDLRAVKPIRPGTYG